MRQVQKNTEKMVMKYKIKGEGVLNMNQLVPTLS